MREETIAFIKIGRSKRRFRFVLVTAILGALAVLLCCAMLMLGNTIYPVSDVVRALSGEQMQGVSFAVNTIRLPRMLAGLFSGFAFGLAGSVFQTLLRNPLANPNIIGITSGSSAAAVFSIVVLQASGAVTSALSVAGGLATVLVTYILTGSKRFSGGRLILIGLGLQAMLNALISWLLLISSESNVPAALRWLSGSLNGSQMEGLAPIVSATLLLTPVVVFFGRDLSMLELGEDSALSLGVHTGRTRVLLIVSSVFLVAIATAATGPISFISFLACPIAKRLVGGGCSHTVPAGLFGAVLVLSADLFGQFAFETRFPVGVITGILGAPYLIFLLIKMNRNGEF
ncbi:Iron ABC transporter permease [uncultured Eubacteriales bacterium]|uniref:Iron ABC transporter permease n=1 Tax=uncultured Eubacteriales bacterium TaxID=172733 RepID=A0A212JEW3_9FIRM|nr:Iron ABC transporter permease [uncultured Eubacteriales bacterium]